VEAMRRGLADLHRPGEVSQQINERYLNALASVDDSARLQQILEPLRNAAVEGRPVRRCIRLVRRRRTAGNHQPGGVHDSRNLQQDLQRALFRNPLLVRLRPDAGLRASAANCGYCAHTGLFTNLRRNLYQVSASGRTS